MKLKILNAVLTVLTVIGIFVIIGAVGSCDYAVEMGMDLPLSKTLTSLLLGVSCLASNIIRGVV